MPIKIQWRSGDIARLKAKMASKRGSVVNTVEKKMWELCLRLERHIQKDKLSGQVLKNRTGTLRRAIKADVTTGSGKIVGIVYVGQEAAKYGAAHEYGATIPPVVGKLMVWNSGGQTIFAMSRKGFQLPERSFMRTALREMQAEFKDELADAVMKAVTK